MAFRFLKTFNPKIDRKIMRKHLTIIKFLHFLQLSPNDVRIALK